MVYKFTNKAKKVIEIANDISIELGHNYIGTEHILYGLVKEGEGIAAKVLNNKGITFSSVIPLLFNTLEAIIRGLLMKK